jgi:Tol biopolymer transport system component
VGQQNWSHIGSSMWTPRYARSGHLIVGDHQGLMAAPFDPKRPQETHPHTFVVDSVYSTPNLSGSWFAVSDTGTLVYVSGDPMLNTVAWVDRSGAVTPVTDKPQAMADLALSPDGTRIAVDTEEALWVIDLRRGSKMRLTQDNETANFYPIWIRHGTQIIFASNRDGEWDLYTAPANGGPASKLLARKGAQFPQSEAADGTIMFSERLQGTATDLFTLSPGGSVAPFIVSPATKLSGQYSPDGRIVAYISDETGRDEVYLRLVAMPEEAVAVSTEGGGEPKWSPDGKELFYRRGDAFFVVNVNTGGGLSVGDARKLFEMPAAWGRSANRAGYAVSSDGKRFLILRPDPRAIPTQINVVTHWFDELKAKVPVR